MIDRLSRLDEALATVPGMMDRRELELLYTLASQTEQTIVELGSFAGLSTIALCLGARATGAQVVTVDAFVSDYRSLRRAVGQLFARSNDQYTRAKWSKMHISPERALRDNLRSFGVSARIIKAYSWAAAEQVDGPVGLLFIDADHTRPAVERDLSAWTPKLSANAVVAFDDYVHDNCPDVAPVANEWAMQFAWCRVDVVSKVAVFRRTAGAACIPCAVQDARAPESAYVAPSPLHQREVEDPRKHVQDYLRAFRDRDLRACMRCFAPDATVEFTGPCRGPERIEQWHRERFDADLQLAEVGPVRLRRGTFSVDLKVESRTLCDWHIGSLPIRANLQVGRFGIEKMTFGLRI
jgi:predicted O-methyltransferase YrrM